MQSKSESVPQQHTSHFHFPNQTSQMGCSGSELKVQDKEVNLAKSGLKFDVKVN